MRFQQMVYNRQFNLVGSIKDEEWMREYLESFNFNEQYINHFIIEDDDYEMDSLFNNISYRAHIIIGGAEHWIVRMNGFTCDGIIVLSALMHTISNICVEHNEYWRVIK